MLQRISYSEFDVFRWLACDVKSMFGCSCKCYELVTHREKLRKHAVGYCEGKDLIVRPKPDHKGVLFFKDGDHFWFHLRNNEFKEIFDEN